MCIPVFHRDTYAQDALSVNESIGLKAVAFVPNFIETFIFFTHY